MLLNKPALQLPLVLPLISAIVSHHYNRSGNKLLENIKAFLSPFPHARELSSKARKHSSSTRHPRTVYRADTQLGEYPREL